MNKFTTIKIALIIATFFVSALHAQDGEALFKAKCNTCHLVDKASTGPILKGVKQKWTDAGETEMLYDWVKNSMGLIASGKSNMANEIKGFSSMDMPAQTVSNEEIDAILGYVDSYVSKAPETTSSSTDASASSSTETSVILKPNYKENLTVFNWLFFTIIVLIITIIILSNSIINLVKSDFFKNKLVEISKQKENEKNNSNGIINSLVIILTTGAILFSSNSMALTFSGPGESESGMPWLLVEKIDIYFMITINFILVGVVFYLKSLFNKLLNMVYKQKVIEVKDVPRIIKLNKVLTDAVPIEDEHKILMEHEYDGIRELDNNLPPWWVWGFFITIVFAVVYLFNYHVLGTGDLQGVAYEKEMKKADAEVKAYLSKMAMNVDETNATLMTESDDLEKGKALFETNCVTCHNPKGEGNIGPNLTDKNWIYGYDIKDVFKTVKLGTPNGMPEHNSKFNPIQIQQVASYVLSLPDAKGKEPQGDILEK